MVQTYGLDSRINCHKIMEKIKFLIRLVKKNVVIHPQINIDVRRFQPNTTCI